MHGKIPSDKSNFFDSSLKANNLVFFFKEEYFKIDPILLKTKTKQKLKFEIQISSRKGQSKIHWKFELNYNSK